MFVFYEFTCDWGKIYFGYGKEGRLYCWGRDTSGQFGMAPCTTSYLKLYQAIV